MIDKGTLQPDPKGSLIIDNGACMPLGEVNEIPSETYYPSNLYPQLILA